MPTPSPLTALVATLAAIRQQARQHQALLSKNEAATRAALIDPILRALGWDTTDVGQVVPEYAVSNQQKPDYFLMRQSGTPYIIIEAKKLGEPLDKLGHTGKLIGYAFSLKPAYYFVTDGLNWHCYSPQHSQYEPYELINLTAANLLPAALQLLGRLDAAHAGHNSAGYPEQLIQAARSAAKPARRPQAKQPKQAAEPTQAYSGFTELAQLSTVSLASGQKPAKLRLPDGTIKTIHTWKDILLEISRFLLLHKQNIQLPLPDKAGKKRFLLALEKPLVGASTLAYYKSKPVFIYTHYSATDCIANALYAENQLPAQSRSMAVAVSF